MEILAKIFHQETFFRDSSAVKLWLQKGRTANVFDEIEAGGMASVLNSIADGIFISDSGLNIKILNKAATDMLGGKPLNECPIFTEDKITRFSLENLPVIRALAGEELTRVDAFLKTPAYPQGVFVEITASPIWDTEGKVCGAVSLIRDISKRKLAEEELKHSKLRLEILTHIVNDFVWEWDLTTDTCWRQGRRSAYGYSQEEIHSVESWWRDKVHPDDQAHIFALHNDLMNGIRCSWRTEFRWKRNDGSYAYLIGQAQVTRRDENKKPTYIMGATLDISERKATEDRLAQLASIVEATDDAVLSVGLDKVIISWNKGAEKLWGYTPEEVIGNDVSILGGAPDALDSAKKFLMAKLLNGESVQRFEWWRRKKNGELMLLSHTVSPIKNSKGELVMACVSARDITDLRKAEEAVQRLNIDLARSNEELKQFASVASHDISEPLRTMASFAALLKRDYQGNLDRRGQEYVDFIVDGSRRMRNLIDSLYEYARVEQTPLNIQKINSNLLMNRLKQDLKYSLEAVHAELVVNDLPLIAADEIQISQLFQNLISNALKFIRREHPRVIISAKGTETETVFSVQDNGIGIEPANQGRIFQTFQRLNPISEFPGSGLGLATCKKIVDRHGGRIWLESTPGVGTIFHFSIPNSSHAATSLISDHRPD